MKESEVEKKLALVIANLGGKKSKINDWITIAETCKELADHFGSAQKVANELGRHYGTVREILKLAELPDEVKELIRERKILYDVGQRIARIRSREDQIKVANAVVGLNSHDARALIQYTKGNPNASLNDFRERIISSKGKVEKIDVLIIPLKSESYKLLKKISDKNKSSPQKFVIGLIDQAIKNSGDSL